ncbi:MAG: hypothetical protein L6V93_06810 [Clostridiales bacterium]|nr:MAG: hypothetical protein L6V93_06810 [Clostridiales bacterium]
MKNSAKNAKCENDLKIAVSQLDDARKSRVKSTAKLSVSLPFRRAKKRGNFKKINEQKYELEKSEGGFLNKIELLKSEIAHNNENINRLKNEK